MDLSSAYSSLYSRRLLYLLRNATQFCYHVYQTGKTKELSSFFIWELMYKTGFFKKRDILKFTPISPFSVQYVEEYLHSSATKLQVHDSLSVSVSSIDWKYCFEDQQGCLWGCEYDNSTTLVKSIDGKTVIIVATFQSTILSLYVSRNGFLFVCVQGFLYRSIPTHIEFTKVLSLTTSESYFLFNRGMTELPDGTFLLGEYASIWSGDRWINLANLYIGTDSGRKWHTTDFLVNQGVNKHIHLVKYSASLKRVFLTDGDNKKQIWDNSSSTNLTQPARKTEHGWRLINRRHIQMGGYTSMVDLATKVIFGTDYLGGTNFIIQTSDGEHFRKVVIPDPYRRSPVINMVSRQQGNTTEIWALLHNSIVASAKCILMYSRDNGSTWTRLIEYNGCAHEIQLVSSSHGQNKTIYFCIRRFENGIEQNQTYSIDTNGPT